MSVEYTCVNLSRYVDRVEADLWTFGKDLTWDSKSAVITALVSPKGKRRDIVAGDGLHKGKYRPIGTIVNVLCSGLVFSSDLSFNLRV